MNSGLSVQLQQRQGGIDVKGLVLALARNIVLEDCGCFGVVTVKAAENCFDVLRPGRAFVERSRHDEGV